MKIHSISSNPFSEHTDTFTYADMVTCVDKSYIPESSYVRLALKLIHRYKDSIEIHMIYHPYPGISDSLAFLKTEYINRSINDSLRTLKTWCYLKQDQFINKCFEFRGNYDSIVARMARHGVFPDNIVFVCNSSPKLQNEFKIDFLTNDSASRYPGEMTGCTACSAAEKLANRRVDYIITWKRNTNHNCHFNTP